MERRLSPPGIELRPPRPSDAEAVHRVRAARDLADLGRPESTVEEVRDGWRRSDPATCARVAVVGGEIVGYAEVGPPGSLLLVSPAHEGDPEIGDRLLDFTEARECAEDREPHRQWLAAADVAHHRRLQARGYHLARSYDRMTIELSRGRPAAPPTPEAHDTPPALPDIRFRELAPEQDARALHRIDQAAFADRPDFVPETLQEFADNHLRAVELDPALSRVAAADREIVGFALVERLTTIATAYVTLLAVDPARQSRGIGARLMRDVFDAAAHADLRAVSLGVASDNPSGRRFYRRLGMRREFGFDVLERPRGDR